MRHVFWLVFLPALAVGCGTGSVSVDVVEPTVTLFADDDASARVESTTTVVPAAILAALDPTELPAPRSEAPGVVILEGIAAPVTASSVDGWAVTTPCGSNRDGAAPAPISALVALDPAGDARTVPGSLALTRNEAIAEATRSRLVAAGIETLVTRTAGADLAASYRREAAAASGALVVVSIATVEGGAATGTVPALEVVHPAADESGRRLAGLVHAAVAPVVGELSVPWPADVEPGVRAVLNQRGDDYFAMLREPMDAARVVLHLPVSLDAASAVANQQNRRLIADALAEAIAEHLVSDREGSGFVAPPEVVRSAPISDASAACVDPLAVVTEPTDD